MTVSFSLRKVCEVLVMMPALLLKEFASLKFDAFNNKSSEEPQFSFPVRHRSFSKPHAKVESNRPIRPRTDRTHPRHYQHGAVLPLKGGHSDARSSLWIFDPIRKSLI